MTTQKHLKARVRSRMAKTGESYAAARGHVVSAAGSAPPAAEVRGIRHVPGIHPETTALRILATHAGLRDPATGGLLSEETMLAAGGGLGAGVFAFHYAKERFSSLYLAGRRSWEDGRSFMEAAARNLGLTASVVETGSTRAADSDLRSALEHGPVAAWVDAAELRYRGLPDDQAGGAYHVVVVYAIEGDAAIVGDLAPQPVTVPLADLARSRARIRAHRHRLLRLAPIADGGTTNHAADAAGRLARGMRAGLRTGADALAAEPRRNFSLRAFDDLARRMTARTGADAWDRVFPPGRLSWIALSSLHRFIETYQTGGGLLRPIGARAIAELAVRTSDDRLRTVADAYADLGRQWSALATAALPDGVPLLAETRELQVAMAAAFSRSGPDAAGAIRDGWARLRAIESEAEDAARLGDDAGWDLRASLAERMRTIHAAEVDALTGLRAALAD